MQVLRSDPLRWGPLRPHGSAITIGVFDGVHRGHRKVIEELTKRAAADRLDTVALTFDRHPLEVVAPERAPRLLSSVEDRLRLFEQLGVDVAGVLPFDEVRSMEAESFVEGVLVWALGARLVAVGTDFRFGHDRRGDVSLLKTMGERFGFEVDEVPLLSEGEGPMSSSRIRAMLEAADVAAACEALGRPFALSGVVVHGDGRGRSIGVPTANLEVDERLALPANGVYAAFAYAGVTYKAAVNVGIRPTFGGERLIVEAHLLDAPIDLDLYGEALTLHFVDRIRPERRFSGVDELVAQIRADIEAVRMRLERAAPDAVSTAGPSGTPTP
jgi:riboflavin kinase / FMN adenylyltransferase